MSGLSEAELHVQAMRLVCEALADREQQGIEVDWDVLRQMYDQMDAMLQDLWHKHRYDSSEMVDLRKDRDAARAEIETLRKELDATNRFASTVASERDAAHAAAMVQQRDETVYYLQARLDEERSVIANLRQQLDAARAAVTLQRAGIERLQAFVGMVREVIDIDCDGLEIDEMIKALAKLDADTEPTPVAEPLDAEGGA